MEGGLKLVHAVYPAHFKIHHWSPNSLWGFPCSGMRNWTAASARCFMPAYWKCWAVNACLAAAAVKLAWVSCLMQEWGQICQLAGFLAPSPKQIHVWTHRLPINYSLFPRREVLLPLFLSHTPAWCSNSGSHTYKHRLLAIELLF